MFAVAVAMGVREFVMIFIITHDHSESLAIRGVVWCIAVLGAFPLIVAVASLVVTCLVHRTLKLTTVEISAPKTGFALKNTVVPLLDVKKVALRSTAARRYLDIYHSAGRLDIAECWLQNFEAFERVLAAVSGLTGR